MKIAKTKHTTNNKKIIVIIIAAVVILGIGGTVSAYYLLSQDQKTESTEAPAIEEYNRNDVDLNESSNEQQQAGEDIKKDSVDKDESQQNGSLSVSFTAVNQSDNSLQVRANISSLTSNGTCELSLTGPNGTVVTKSSGVQALASNSTCQGFDIPLSELSKGSWTVKLKVTTNNVTGEVSQTTEIR